MQVGGGLGHRHPWLEPRDRRRVPAIASAFVRPCGEGNPQVAYVGEVESGRHHADHRPRPTIQWNRLADERGISGESALPQPVTEDDFVVPARRVFLSQKVTTER